MPPEMLQYGISTEKSDIVSNLEQFEYDYYIVQLSVVVWSYMLGSVQPGFHSLSWSGKLRNARLPKERSAIKTTYTLPRHYVRYILH